MNEAGFVNDQPLIKDDFKEKLLWGEILAILERLQRLESRRINPNDLDRIKLDEQIESFRNTLEKTFG